MFGPFYFCVYGLFLFLGFLPGFLIDQTGFIALSAKSEISIILSEKQPVLCAACHHPVRLMIFFCYKVINKNTYVSL